MFDRYCRIGIGIDNILLSSYHPHKLKLSVLFVALNSLLNLSRRIQIYNRSRLKDSFIFHFIFSKISAL